MARTIETSLARGGVQGDNTHAFAEPADSGADLFNGSSEFVAKKGGWDNHARVIATLIYLKISATS